MIYSIYSDKDATIYNKFPDKNTGQDSILELTKETYSGSNSLGNYVSRFLIKFDISEIQTLITQGKIVNPTYYLKLYTSEVQEIPYSYTLKGYAISQSWEMGIGKEDNIPQTTEGVSWHYRDGLSNSTTWTTSSLANGSTSYQLRQYGGGTWYSSYTGSQDYEYESTDLNMNITDIVNQWVSGSIPNDGIIIKRSDQDEQNGNNLGIIKFFSRDTHTIYQPKLEVKWDNSIFITGSLTPINENNSHVIYLKKFKHEYSRSEKARILVTARREFPVRTYTTESIYLTSTNYLPSSSYFAVYDAHSEEPIIDFDEQYTKVCCDSYGNYIDLWMDSLQPERYYRLKFKVKFDNTEEQFDNKYIFKVVK